MVRWALPRVDEVRSGLPEGGGLPRVRFHDAVPPTGPNERRGLPDALEPHNIARARIARVYVLQDLTGTVTAGIRHVT